MLRIPLHIERILLVNDCVIIPDFGGFILRRHAAVHKARECAFLPARKEIVFNPTLTHNDGLLAESYMEMYGMDFNEAQQAIRHDVSALLTTLDDEGTLSLDTIGTLSRNDNGALLFAPADETPIYGIGSYGLPLFYMPPLAAEPSEAQTIALPTVAEPSPARSLMLEAVKMHLPTALRVVGQTAAVAAVACAFYFALSTPVKDVDQSAYTAGFVPSELLNDLTEKGVSSTSAQPDAQPTTNDEKQAHSQQAVEQKMYSVIIASLDNRKAAEQVLAELTPAERDRARILTFEKIRKHRIVIGTYTNRKEAEAELARWRKKPKFQSAWLMVRH